MARDIKKKDKICIVCGETFKATASAQTCTPACRADLVRLKAAGNRPQFMLAAKTKGQKIPNLNAPKRVKYALGEKKQPDISKGILHTIEQSPIVPYEPMTMEKFTTIQWATQFDKSADTQPPLTKEQIWEKINALEKKKKEVKERNVLGGSPKAAALQKSMEIDKIDEEIQYLKSLTPPTSNPL